MSKWHFGFIENLSKPSIYLKIVDTKEEQKLMKKWWYDNRQTHFKRNATCGADMKLSWWETQNIKARGKLVTHVTIIKAANLVFRFAFINGNWQEMQLSQGCSRFGAPEERQSTLQMHGSVPQMIDALLRCLPSSVLLCDYITKELNVLLHGSNKEVLI